MLVEGGSEVPNDCIHLVILAVNALQHSKRIRSSNHLSMGWQSPRFPHIEQVFDTNLGTGRNRGQSRQRGVIEMREPAIVFRDQQKIMTKAVPAWAPQGETSG
jgi:hypothetical protein